MLIQYKGCAFTGILIIIIIIIKTLNKNSQQLTFQETLIDVDVSAVSVTVGAGGAVRSTAYRYHT